MQITVLGKSPSWQDVDGACSGYLVEEDATAIVLDCGNGVFGKLRRYRDYCSVDAVVISHLHADHFLDLVPFAYALTYGPGRQGVDGPTHPQLHAPRGARETFRRVVGAWGNEDLIEAAFDLREYDPDAVVEIASLRVRFQAVPHYLATHAVEVAAGNGGGRFTFGADCRPSEELVEFARDTDLLIAEATLPRPEPDGVRGHLTPAEAGDHGRRAAARRLVLTHISDELDQDWARQEAQREFGGPVEVAREGAVYAV
ncbi:MAG: MBL fold metallo-hydrolase [Actinomycetota bacterium]|nr:MBL fold metallo-hydrolase [Actinomycetota bacterium]